MAFLKLYESLGVKSRTDWTPVLFYPGCCMDSEETCRKLGAEILKNSSCDRRTLELLRSCKGNPERRALTETQSLFDEDLIHKLKQLGSDELNDDEIEEIINQQLFDREVRFAELNAFDVAWANSIALSNRKPVLDFISYTDIFHWLLIDTDNN